MPEGQEIVRKLVATADVVVANLPPQTLAAMKLDYDSLTAVKPDIILTTVTAYGRGGPYSDRVGFDGIGQVMSGAVYMTGTEDQPYRAQVPWVDFGTALHCAFGTMAALMARKVTGKGQVVEGALLATAVTFGNALLIEQAVIAPNRVPTGNRGQTAAPVDIFRTKDGWILAQVIGEPLYKRWAKLMGEDALADRSALQGRHLARRQRRRHQRAHEPVVRRATPLPKRWRFSPRPRIPSGPVLKPQQTLDDPHIQAMGFFQPTEFPGAPKPAPIAKAPVWLSGTPGSIRRRAPTLGEHTDQILTEARLRQEGDRQAQGQGRCLSASTAPRPGMRGRMLGCTVATMSQVSRSKAQPLVVRLHGPQTRPFHRCHEPAIDR